MNNKLISGITAAAMAAGLGLGAATLANADTTPSPGPTTTTSPAPSDETTTTAPAERDLRPADRGGRGMGGPDLSALADKLGVEQDALAEAVQAAREATRPEAPASGQDPADRETRRAEHQAAFAEALAEELDLTATEVQEALDDVRAERTAQRTAADKAALDQAVTDGALTRAEADAVQKAIEAGIVSVHGGRGPHR